MIKDPPINDITLLDTNRFTTRWILWFNSIVKDFNSLFSTVEEVINTFGWAYYDDSQYTSGSPLNINNTTTQVTIDGLGSSTELSYLPDGISFFDTTTSEITPENIGDSYILRFDFNAISASNNVLFDVEIDIGSGSPNLVYDQTLTIVKGSNTEQRYSLAIPIYTLNTFLTNGGKIKIATTNNVNFYDFGLFITRVSKPL